ncbi:MAG: hypothetical protein J6Y95_08165, partial [Lachnospiraceae bacterium]|nr:hypothetical protein [Lachnospiraceae bacterium]
MSEIRVIPTENAGAVLYLGGLCIWADVLNEENPDSYEVLSEAHFQRLLSEEAFRPDLILFTHRHPDHFSERRLLETLQAYPETQLFIGGTLAGKTEDLQTGALRVTVFPLPHEGKAYIGEENDAFLLCAPEATVLIPGDCPVGCPALFEALDEWRARASETPCKRLDLAFLNFPWLSLGKGRKALFSLNPGHVLFCHLPAPSDDVYGYREQAERMLERFKGDR